MYRKSPSKIWRKNSSRFRLVGTKFIKSNKTYYPPRNVVPGSTDTSSQPYEFSQKAILITWSVVYSPPSGFERNVPYGVGIFLLEDSQRFTGQIVDVDYDRLKKGDIFYPTFRKIFEASDRDVIQYGLKWSK